MRRKSSTALAAGSLLLAAAAPAMAVNIGGIDIPLGPVFTAGQIYSTLPTAAGQELTAYGKVDSINSTAVSELCSDCELTYRVSGYTVDSITSSSVASNGGLVQFYLGTGADNDFAITGSGNLNDDIAAATNGTLFLTLRGHEINAAGNTFITTSQNIGTGLLGTAFGTGLADVDTSAGGIANQFFNSNAINAQFGGAADVQLNGSWSPLNPLYVGQGDCGAAGCLRGSADFHAVAVPEPETYALMLSALGLIGYVVHRRRRV
jgi:hypothetical protein